MKSDNDITSYWQAHKDRRRAKKAQNIAYSTQMLVEAGIEFTRHNDGIHIRIGKYIDFWPGTGKWLDHETGKAHRGVKSLITEMKRREAHDSMHTLHRAG